MKMFLTTVLLTLQVVLMAVFQNPRQHGLQHSDPKHTYYCPVTNQVNPIRERLNFWPHVESLVERLTGATHRHDTAVSGQGSGRGWIGSGNSGPNHAGPTR